MRIRSVVALLAGCFTLSGCQGLKDALSAHTDVVARTVSQELTVTRLSTLLGNAKIPVQITKENATTLANIWNDYHRLAYAAAHNDTMTDKISAAVNPILDNQRVSMWMDSLRSKYHVDSANEGTYDKAGGGLYMARHILFAYPAAATAAQKDSVKKVAESIRPQITAANFGAMAKKYSKDPGTAADSGNLPPFPLTGRGSMVKPFADATAALKPGDISGLVETQFGYHIIERLPWADAKAQYSQTYTEAQMVTTDSTLIENAAKASDLQLKADAPANARDAIKEIAKHHDDHTVMATFSKGGKFTVADFLMWVNVMPPQYRQQVIGGLPGAVDSEVKPFVKQMALRTVILRAADSAKLDVPAKDRTMLSDQFKDLVVQTWKQLNIAPEQLTDSAKSTGDKERLASARIDHFIDAFMAGQAQPSLPPPPLEMVLDAKYKSSVSSAGIDRAVTEGEKIKAASEPASSVPLPGGPPGMDQQGPPPGPPPASAPATKPPPGGTNGTKPPGTR